MCTGERDCEWTEELGNGNEWTKYYNIGRTMKRGETKRLEQTVVVEWYFLWSVCSPWHPYVGLFGFCSVSGRSGVLCGPNACTCVPGNGHSLCYSLWNETNRNDSNKMSIPVLLVPMCICCGDAWILQHHQQHESASISNVLVLL